MTPHPAPGLHRAGRAAVALLFGVPLALALGHGLAQALQPAGWRALADEPACPPALAASLRVAALATLLALAALLALLPALHGRPAWPRLLRWLGPWLALPHAALAIGLALLLAPSGLPARLLAPLFGWQHPPDWPTLQDPWGLGLAAGLLLKELPFLLWCAAAELARPDRALALQRQLAAARTLGCTPAQAWWRVAWPQLLPRLGWPLAAVWSYALTSLDMALVLGPARPPTLSVLAWGWLQHPDPLRQQQGAAAALLLALAGGAGIALALLAWRVLWPRWLAAASSGRRARPGADPADPSAPAASSAPPAMSAPTAPAAPAVARTARAAPGAGAAGALLAALALPCLAAGALLALASVAARWPFPQLLPVGWTFGGWALAISTDGSLPRSAALGLAAALLGVGLALAWLRSTPARWDGAAALLVFVPLWWPAPLLAAGAYRALLPLGLDGSATGVLLAHGLATTPYAFIALAPAVRGFDERYVAVARSLGAGGWRRWWQVRLPLLAAPLASALAIAFAVSIAQYALTQMAGAGRWATVTTEALTLAAGGAREQLAAFALLQALLPALAFGAAAALGRWQLRRLGPGFGQA